MKLSDLINKPNSPEQAEEKITAWKEEKSKIQNRIEELTSEVANIEEEASEVALKDSLEGTSGSGNVQRRLQNKQNELNAKEKALSKVQYHLENAEKEKLLSMAAEKRKEAQKLDDEAEGIEKEAEKHLKKLEEIQGCKYVPFINTWSGQPLEVIDNSITKDYVSPQSEILRGQANQLKKKASELEKKAEKTAQSAKQEKAAAV